MITIFELPRGQTLDVYATVTDTDNNNLPVDLTGYTITSQIKTRRKNDDVDTLKVTIVDAINGLIRCVALNGTDNYPMEELWGDLRVVNANNYVAYTNFFTIKMIPTCTQK